MANINNLPNSPRWGIMQTLLAALQASPTLDGILVVRNPRSAKTLAEAAHWVALKDRVDALNEKPGQVEKRKHQFELAAVARSEAADSEADAVHEAAANALRAAIKTVSTTHCQITNITEVSTRFESDNLEVGGALCVSTWEFEYRKTNPL